MVRARLQVEPLENRDVPNATPTFVPGELLVSFKPGVSQAEIGRSYAAHGATEKAALDRFSRADAAHLKLVSVPADRTLQIRSELERDPRVAYVEPNYLFTNVMASATPDDLYYVAQHHLNNTGQWTSTPDADLDAPEAWSMTTGSPDVLVAVIDNGVDYNNPDLVANMWTNPFETPGDGIDNDGNGYVDDVHGISAVDNSGDPMADPNGIKADHGTAVSGVIGARPFNEGSVGVAWRVGVVAVRLVDSNDTLKTSDAVEAFQYINYLKNVAGQNIVASNCSWSWPWNLPNSRAVRDAMAGVDQPGMSPILHVVGAANANNNNDTNPVYPGSFDLDNIISVAATDWNDQYASFSNYGATSVDLAACGVNVITTDLYNNYNGDSGTSLAAPQVAGAAALVASAFPGLTAAQIKQRILAGVDPIGQIGNNSLKPTLTNGRLNVANALAGAPVDHDHTAPAAVGTLATAATTFHSVRLTWTATGDDGASGRASFYDLRYSTSPITTSTWDSAIRIPGEFGPKAAGAAESFTVPGLDPGRTYYFALKVRDNMGNESALSNVAAGTTAAAATLFGDDMEHGANGWTASGLWHQSPYRSNSAAKSWYYGNDATRTYDTGAANGGALTSPTIDLRKSTHPVLIYREWRTVEDWPNTDLAHVEVNTNGNQWELVSRSSVSTAFNTPHWQDRGATFGWNVSVEFPVSTPQWVSRSVDLSAYVGKRIQVRFGFNTVDALFNGYEGWYVDDVNVFDAAAPLLASASAPANANARSLTLRQSRPLLTEALARWRAAGFDIVGLGNVQVRIGDLGGATLGLASGHTIWLDDNAAGWGWFVDRTPQNDSEFWRRGNQGEQNRMDLLTVLEHEVGHLLDHEHNTKGVMQATLSVGYRLTPHDVELNGSWGPIGLPDITTKRDHFGW
jgi:subtilisin family serine protease